MWKRRQIFNAVFFIGTIIAAVGWIGELRDWPIVVVNFFKFGNLAITGHILQIIGAFGILVTPEGIEVIGDGQKDFSE